MPGDAAEGAPLSLDALLAELRELRAVLTAPPTAPQLFDPAQAAAYCGLSKSGLYRLLGAGQFPRAVTIHGTGPRWKRADLDRWIAALKPSRRKSRTATPAE